MAKKRAIYVALWEKSEAAGKKTVRRYLREVMPVKLLSGGTLLAVHNVLVFLQIKHASKK